MEFLSPEATPAKAKESSLAWQNLEPAFHKNWEEKLRKNQLIPPEPAIEALARESHTQIWPRFNAKNLFSVRIYLAVLIGSITISFLLGFRGYWTLAILGSIIHAFYLINVLYKGWLQLKGFEHPLELYDWNKAIENYEKSGHTWPSYTILVPLFREANMLSTIIANLNQLDYPRNKLDIKLILEESDTETWQKAIQMNLPDEFQIILVPRSFLQTKPKAMNYALRWAKGEYVTVFDGEDAPDPLQLKKAVIYLSQAPKNVVGVQAQLNFFNRFENTLTRLFTLDYSLWFDFFIPGLERNQAIIPLGGTSNHFRMSALKELGGWDSYNVTEDADLGVKVSLKGWQMGFLPSTTWEEATVKVVDWIKQRTRWVKGYMVTYLVYMKHPIEFFRKVGMNRFIQFQLFFGLPWIINLLNPFLYVHFLYWLTSGKGLNIDFLKHLAIWCLVVGNGLQFYLALIGTYKRGFFKLIPWVIFIPVYWFLLSIASWRALWHLLIKPHDWEKTPHGKSQLIPTGAKVADTLALTASRGQP